LSGTNVGITVVVLERLAVLPLGAEISNQR
jgi:hypothetical protein